jgi:hypothetical protein
MLSLSPGGKNDHGSTNATILERKANKKNMRLCSENSKILPQISEIERKYSYISGDGGDGSKKLEEMIKFKLNYLITNDESRFLRNVGKLLRVNCFTSYRTMNSHFSFRVLPPFIS